MPLIADRQWIRVRTGLGLGGRRSIHQENRLNPLELFLG
jgi:hypothetical protein